MTKNLIAYFSRKGNNYVGGSIVNLPVGNTEVIARKIQKMAGGDMFRIETVKAYPADYKATTEVAKDEKRANARPELVGKVAGMGKYEVLILGFPNWCGTMPMAVAAFLEAYDLSGKTILPYCTHEGSGLGTSGSDIRNLCPDAKVLPGLAIVGGSVAGADKAVEGWLMKAGLKS